MSEDIVRLVAGGLLEVVTASGWEIMISPSEITSIRGRREGGAAIYTRHGSRPILLNLSPAAVRRALEGADYATP